MIGAGDMKREVRSVHTICSGGFSERADLGLTPTSFCSLAVKARKPPIQLDIVSVVVVKCTPDGISRMTSSWYWIRRGTKFFGMGF